MASRRIVRGAHVPQLAPPGVVAPVLHRVQPAPGGYHVVHPGGGKEYVSTHHGSSAAAAPAVAPGAPVAPPVPSSLDSQYFADAAKNTFDVNQGLTQNDLQGQQRRASLEEALRRLSAQQPRDEQTTTQAANRQGLFYSGALGQRLGDLATKYSQQRSDMNSQFSSEEATRLAARAALQQGYGVNDAALRAAAVERQIASDQAAADAGALVAPQTPVTAGQVKTATGEAAPRPKPKVTAGQHVTPGPGGRLASKRRHRRITI
jgi:hypothetical protein